MHALIDDVFDVAGVLVAVVRIAASTPNHHTYRGVLHQKGLAVTADHSKWFEVRPRQPVSAAKTNGKRRRTPSPLQPLGQTYLVAFTGDNVAQLSRDTPVTVSVHTGPAVIGHASLGVSDLGLIRLEEPAFKTALQEAMEACERPEVASVMGASISLAPIENFGSLQIKQAALANEGLVLQGWIPDCAQRDLRIVTADLCCWRARPQITLHPTEGRSRDSRDTVDAGTQRSFDFGFTTVLTTRNGGKTELVYFVEVDPTGAEATFYGPVTVTGSADEQEALQLVQQAFGPIQSLPRPVIRQIYWPLLALPKAQVRARRFDFGPAVDGAKPLSSIVIPFYGDAFFLSCVFHLLRVLTPGFELVLVVDDPRIWPEVYGRLSARRSSITVPTSLLQCTQNYGYARANNLGVSAARGDVLFLMNSDIMVLDSTSLTEAASVIRTRRQAGKPEAIIGFSLLFEDETIQHVGMEFPRSPLVGNLRLADHPMKGFPMALYEGEARRQVPAVTGALMGLSSHLYRSLGGFDTAYERGDFEDADLCLRAKQVGAEVWVHVRPGLYHLERQSIRQMGDASLRDMITYMNCVEFNARWDTPLSEEAARRTRAPAHPAPERKTISVRKRNLAEAASQDERLAQVNLE